MRGALVGFRIAYTMVDLPRLVASVTAEFDRIAVENDLIGPGRGGKSIVRKRPIRMEVERENHPGPFKTDHVVAAVFVQQMRSGGRQQSMLPGQGDHLAVESGQQMIR